MGSVGAAFSLIHAKFDLIRSTDARLRAQAACEAAVDRVRADGLPGLPAGEATLEGFRPVAAFTPEGPLPEGEGLVEARALRVERGDGHDLYEVRVTVRWRDAVGGAPARLTLSTLAPLPATGGAR